MAANMSAEAVNKLKKRNGLLLNVKTLEEELKGFHQNNPLKRINQTAPGQALKN